MRYLSTSGRAPQVPFRTALLEGLAPDGGLYLPDSIPRLSEAWMRGLRDRSIADIGTEIASKFVDELPTDELQPLIADTLDFEMPLIELEPGVFVLELFHGPTLAFKDVGARFMARMFSALHEDDDRPLTVVVATSGDTGGAVARAFYGVPRTHASDRRGSESGR